MEQTTVQVDGMACDGCEQNVTETLETMDGISSVSADHERGAVDVEYDPTAIESSSIGTAVEDAGYDVVGYSSQ